MLTGSAGLLPVQQWYLEREEADLSHFNLSILLSINKAVPEDVLRAAVEHLTAHHDALRFEYHRDAKSGWQQGYGSFQGGLVTEDLQAASAGSSGCFNQRVWE